MVIPLRIAINRKSYQYYSNIYMRRKILNRENRLDLLRNI